jgi:hypothetical protein
MDRPLATIVRSELILLRGFSCSIGALYAVKKNVTVVCSGGNSGPTPGSVSNVAPWILTVGASTMDRDFPAYFTFGNRAVIKV